MIVQLNGSYHYFAVSAAQRMKLSTLPIDGHFSTRRSRTISLPWLD
jgi:hypothetical protein